MRLPALNLNSEEFMATIMATDMESMTIIPLGNSELRYEDYWLLDAERWYNRLRTEMPWSPEKIKMYGRPLVLKRETVNYGDDYDYNPDAKPAVAWSGPALELKELLEEFTGRVFTQCACNYYPDGATGIGLHHDKKHPKLIASISFGAVRTMGFAPKGGKLDKSLPMIPSGVYVCRRLSRLRSVQHDRWPVSKSYNLR
jgi:alkylated DNA repair dioxygenase AlkB